MEAELIFVPVVMQFLVTMAAYAKLAVAKRQAVQNGELDVELRGLSDDAWPENVVRVLRNIRIQYEIPVLFYVMVIVLWELNAATTFSQIFAWLFVISRMIHDHIHTSPRFSPLYRYIRLRRGVLVFGMAMVMVLALTVVKELIFGK